jgi:hypothetical protein
MSDEQKRRVETALWHARESLLHASAGDDDTADYHLEAGKEFLALVDPRAAKVAVSADDLVLQCTLVCDSAGLVPA